MKIIDVGIGIVVRQIPNKTTTDSDPQSATYELLITQRKHDTVFGGYWELPGGKADPGEPIEQCVRRELLEEVGVVAHVVRSLLSVVHTYPHGTVRLHPRICRLAPDSPAPADLHVAEHRWCPLDALDEHQFPPANESIVRELREVLARGIDLSDPAG